MRWYLIVVLIFISLMISWTLNTFSSTCWPSVHHHWKNSYSDPLPFFKVFIYLFIWLHQILVVSHLLLSCRQVGSLVVACMWDLVPWPGIEPRPPALGAWNLNHCATREVPFCPFFNQIGFLLVSCMCSIDMDMSPLSDMWFANMFSHSVGYLFILFVSFEVWKLFSLMYSICLFFNLLLFL